MKRKTIYLTVACITFVVGITAASIWYFPRYIWRPISMDGASETRVGVGGRGIAYSSTTWKSLDGVIVDEMSVAYPSSEEARKDFEEELKGAGTIIEREGNNDNERIVRIFGNPQTKGGAAEIVRLQGKEINYIKAVSLRHALTFEKSWLKLLW